MSKKPRGVPQGGNANEKDGGFCFADGGGLEGPQLQPRKALAWQEVREITSGPCEGDPPLPLTDVLKASARTPRTTLVGPDGGFKLTDGSEHGK